MLADVGPVGSERLGDGIAAGDLGCVLGLDTGGGLYGLGRLVVFRAATSMKSTTPDLEVVVPEARTLGAEWHCWVCPAMNPVRSSCR